ncbi:hypothetical protein LCGC14_3000970 [marine sediment metagenome]|uniref:Uncharacterized protein n=1 Tax=marine sediment metagenome TaxID=412755 RepID=A0A0F8X0Y9_9ZZZZ
MTQVGTWVEQKPLDEIDDCEQWPSCYMTFRDLNRLRTSTYYVMRSWVPEWLWVVTPRFAKGVLRKKVQGDLTAAGILRGAELHRKMKLAEEKK